MSDNETTLNCSFGFAIANPIKAAALGLQLYTQLKTQFKAVSLIKFCVTMKYFIIILSEIPCLRVQEKENAAGCIYLIEFWRCINSLRCVKKRHAARCIHKMQAILSVYTFLAGVSFWL